MNRKYVCLIARLEDVDFMRTEVEFRSSRFPSLQNDVEGPNWEAGVFGKRLADYLVAHLPKHDIKIKKAIDEDWGWCLVIDHDGGFEHFIGCGHQYGADDCFLCFVTPNKPAIRRWFRKIDVSSQIKKATDALDAILSADKDITNIRWRFEGQG